MPSCDDSWEVRVLSAESLSALWLSFRGLVAQEQPILTSQGLRENLSVIGKSLFLL